VGDGNNRSSTHEVHPCSVILLVPTDDDARRNAVDEVEPSFEESPALHELIQRGRLDGRNTLVMKAFNSGGSLKILAARAPRNLRMHDAKVLLIDEADAMEITIEGDPILLAEKRTVAHPDRKIVCGSTPTSEDTSVVARRFDESTQEIFEVPCPECGAFNEIACSNIERESGEPETAKYMCPHCKAFVDERNKPDMVDNGRWRALKPDVVGHRGFRINALVSLLPNASWGQLAREYLDAKRGGPCLPGIRSRTTSGATWTKIYEWAVMLLPSLARA
jgi:phage terminase large subunit GpA-like protein